jgi:hypothetical protein
VWLRFRQKDDGQFALLLKLAKGLTKGAKKGVAAKGKGTMHQHQVKQT